MKDSQQNARPKILLVDDEADFCAITALGLKKLGYDVVTALSACDALNIMRTNRPDLVLMDVSLEGHVDGIEAADKIRSDFDMKAATDKGTQTSLDKRLLKVLLVEDEATVRQTEVCLK
jgi:CheY-like chemotaxis protein